MTNTVLPPCQLIEATDHVILLKLTASNPQEPSSQKPLRAGTKSYCSIMI
jgi:hypothetical protein